MKLSKRDALARRHRRVRAKISGTAERPRLAVHRSLQHIYVQAIDDVAGRTLAAACSNEPAFRSLVTDGLNGGTVAGAAAVGKLLAERATAKGIVQAVFDRGGYPYHGRVKALADGAREGGLAF